MSDFNTTSFLTELDSFGQPPPQQKLINGDDRRQQFTHKLDKINLRKQQEMLLPSQNGMVRLAEQDPSRRIRKEIKTDEVQKWRDDVLHSNRPRNQYSSWHRETADSAKEYVKMLSSTSASASPASPLSTTSSAALHISNSSSLRQPIHCTITADNTSDSDEGRNTDSSTSNLHVSPNKDVPLPMSNGILHERKHSDYSSASSQKSSSPFESSARCDTSPYAEYSNLYKDDQSQSLNGKRSPPIQTFNAMFRNETKPTFVNGIGRDLPQQSQPPRRQGKSLAELVKKEFRTTPEIRVPQDKSVQPKGKPPVFRPISEEQRSKKVRWNEMEKLGEEQDERVEALRSRIRNELVFQPSQILGMCTACERDVRERDEHYTVGNDLYHPECFVCDVCNRQLETTNFFVDQRRLFCKQDYLFKMEKRVQSCRACGEPLADMVLTALGHTYHPQCFKCAACRVCLDGVPFALDNQNRPFCMPDYYERFAPRCASCRKPILPENDSGETVRIVSDDKDYHTNCYICENCGISLADENTGCYPLDGHLLCQSCHMKWAFSDSPRPPITDL